VLYSRNITITHQGYLFALDADDAVNNIATTLYPCQDHMTNLQMFWLYQINTFLAANDKGQHAISFNWKGNTQALINQGNGILDNLVV
jgi:hypothetical protein